MARPKYGSDIQTAREKLMQVAQSLRDHLGLADRAAEVEGIVRAHMYRRRAGRKGANTSTRLTPAVVARIENYLNTTDMPQPEIAAIVGVNPGRVSEIANRLRDASGRVKP